MTTIKLVGLLQLIDHCRQNGLSLAQSVIQSPDRETLLGHIGEEDHLESIAQIKVSVDGY